MALKSAAPEIRECLVWEGEVNPHPPLIEFPGLLLQPWRGGGQDSCWLMKSLVFPNVPISFPLSPAINVHGPWSEAHTFLSGWRHGHRSGSRRRKAAGGTRGSRSAAATIACELQWWPRCKQGRIPHIRLPTSSGGFLTRRTAGGNRDGNNIVGKFEISGEILAEIWG